MARAAAPGRRVSRTPWRKGLQGHKGPKGLQGRKKKKVTPPFGPYGFFLPAGPGAGGALPDGVAAGGSQGVELAAVGVAVLTAQGLAAVAGPGALVAAVVLLAAVRGERHRVAGRLRRRRADGRAALRMERLHEDRGRGGRRRQAALLPSRRRRGAPRQQGSNHQTAHQDAPDSLRHWDTSW